MPRNYTEIQSPVILEQLVHTSFEERQKIDDLLKLESYVKDGARGMAGNMQYRLLRSKYPTEYLAFLQEKSPELYEAELQRRQNLHAEEQQRQADLESQRAEELSDWLAAGGLR